MSIPQAFDALKTLFVKVLSLLNPDGNSSLYEEAAEQLIDFEIKLAEVYIHVIIDLSASADFNISNGWTNKLTKSKLMCTLCAVLRWLTLLTAQSLYKQWWPVYRAC